MFLVCGFVLVIWAMGLGGAFMGFCLVPGLDAGLICELGTLARAGGLSEWIERVFGFGVG